MEDRLLCGCARIALCQREIFPVAVLGGLAVMSRRLLVVVGCGGVVRDCVSDSVTAKLLAACRMPLLNPGYCHAPLFNSGHPPQLRQVQCK
jgi:hypothetical protein